jgi:hypothetical protein
MVIHHLLNILLHLNSGGPLILLAVSAAASLMAFEWWEKDFISSHNRRVLVENSLHS